MGKGYLNIRTVSADGEVKINNAAITITDKNGHVIYDTHTDENGNSINIPLPAPNKSNTFNPGYAGPHFYRFNVLARANGYGPVMYEGVSIFDANTTLLTVVMEPGRQDQEIKHINIGRHALDFPEEREIEEQAAQPKITPNVIIGVGARGNNVLHIQQAINRLADVYPGRLLKVKEDGIFGNETRNAVIFFQRLFNLEEDGLVGPRTWNTLMLEAFNHHQDSEISIQSTYAASGDAIGDKRFAKIMSVILANHLFNGYIRY
ncbi:MAG: peptidoglycan-binding protein [Defluviitaleaceae bacterium]|nr:peptidoglycan-binding protein [Defluviitaleaceae bacterium]